ncbi:MAG: type II secretion system F family protein [Gammaproteobacteria bacterium]|nr:type II secretion system F family protein [Gammaproteobacteria bacterium]
MASFAYKAATRSGEVLVGRLECASADEAVARLQAQGHIPIRVELALDHKIRERPRRQLIRRAIGADTVTDFTRELATLLQAGVPLDRALGMLAETVNHGEMTAVVADLQSNVRQGATLADALAGHDQVFSRFYINLVRAGESGGALETVLLRLAEHLEQAKETRESIMAAMIYPVILMLVAVGAVVLLLTYVVPQFAQLFKDVGEALPLPTQIVIAAGDFMQQYAWMLLLAVIGVGYLVRAAWRRPPARRRMESLLLRLPLLGDLLIKADTARFARTLGTLLDNGVVLLNAVAIAREVVANRVLADRLAVVADKVKAGGRFSDELGDGDVLPRFAVQMILVGEESGELTSMLFRVADAYERNLRSALKRALALLEPALILTLGVVVAGIVMSILVAILGVNQLAF